jgi:hypothetical protein
MCTAPDTAKILTSMYKTFHITKSTRLPTHSSWDRTWLTRATRGFALLAQLTAISCIELCLGRISSCGLSSPRYKTSMQWYRGWWRKGVSMEWSRLDLSRWDDASMDWLRLGLPTQIRMEMLELPKSCHVNGFRSFIWSSQISSHQMNTLNQVSSVHMKWNHPMRSMQEDEMKPSVNWHEMWPSNQSRVLDFTIPPWLNSSILYFSAIVFFLNHNTLNPRIWYIWHRSEILVFDGKTRDIVKERTASSSSLDELGRRPKFHNAIHRG